MRKLGFGLACLAILLGISWAIQGNAWFMYKIFAPQYEGVRRQVFEQSKAYNTGMIQELQNMRLEYNKATPEHRLALRSIILHRSADFPPEKMPSDLRSFIENLRSEVLR